MKQQTRFWLSLSLFSILLNACAPASTPDPVDINALNTQAVSTVFAGATQTALAAPTATNTPEPSPTAIRTPPALPSAFETDKLNPLDQPVGYIQDTCQYLNSKWNPNNAAPGTVVMVIMFHGLSQGELSPTSPSYYQDMSLKDFRRLMNDLHEMGFEAISTQQMADFMYENAKIPHRSVLLIQDDRKNRENFDVAFYKYYKDYGWVVVNSYITKDEREDLWQQNAEVEAEGWVDHQAHGFVHNTNITNASSEDYMRQELGKPFEMFAKYFNKAPIAYIWPGGGFTKRAAEIAREFNYKLGFTVNPRGPVMFNWIPQSQQEDPARPSYIPEGPAADPLMTLPRYWSPDARNHLDTVRIIGDQATAYAESVKSIELEYYDIVCVPTYGPIPTPLIP